MKEKEFNLFINNFFCKYYKYYADGSFGLRKTIKISFLIHNSHYEFFRDVKINSLIYQFGGDMTGEDYWWIFDNDMIISLNKEIFGYEDYFELKIEGKKRMAKKDDFRNCYLNSIIEEINI